MSFDQKIFFGAIFTIPLIITPGLNFDAIGIPKFITLVTLGALLTPSMFNLRNLEVFKTNKVLATTLITFVSIILINPFIINRNIPFQLYGGDSRLTGVISNIFLVVFLITGMNLATRISINMFGKIVVIVGVLSGAYGIVQNLGLDPVSWDNPYNQVIGFVGNPNQQSSLLGISSVVIFAFLLRHLKSFKIILLLVILFILIEYVIYSTNSTQGFIVSAAGCSFILWIRIKFSDLNRIWKLTYLFVVLTTFSYAVLDIFRITQGSYLYKESISLRGDFWRAALEMTKENPITGIGFDGYANWYRRSRDSVAASRGEIDSVSDSPHNFLLDYLSSGGIPLFVAFMSLNIFILISLVKLYRSLTDYNLEVGILLGIWIAYTLQALISPIHISLSIWGWALSGLIIGLQIKENRILSTDTPAKRIPSMDARPILVIKKFAAIVTALIITLPLYFMDHSYRVAFKSGKAQDFLNATNSWPQFPIRLATVGNLFLQNNLTDLGKPILYQAIRIGPDSYPSWFILEQFPNLTENEREIVKSNLLRLEPRYILKP
jgi:O-antigen ligase